MGVGVQKTDKLGGNDPILHLKAWLNLQSNHIVKSYFNNDLVKIGIGRAGNVIGGGDWSEDRIVPDCIKAWSK